MKAQKISTYLPPQMIRDLRQIAHEATQAGKKTSITGLVERAIAEWLASRTERKAA